MDGRAGWMDGRTGQTDRADIRTGRTGIRPAGPVEVPPKFRTVQVPPRLPVMDGHR